MIYIKTIILAIALYVFLRSVRIIFNILPVQSVIKKILLKFFPVIEMLSWIAYAFWAADQLFYNQVLLTIIKAGIIIILLSVFGWYLLRDLIAGIILKIENTIKPGQNISFSSLSGKINKIGYRTLEITNDNGETVEIPFSNIVRQNVVILLNKEKRAGHTIRLKVSTVNQPEKIKEVLEKHLLEMPWIISNDDIDINIIREDKDNFNAEIKFKILSSDMVFKTEELLNKYIKEEFGH